jgi:hypothetical protein
VHIGAAHATPRKQCLHLFSSSIEQPCLLDLRYSGATLAFGGAIIN